MLKKPKREDAEALRYFAHTSSTSQASTAFLAGRWNSEWKPEKANSDEDMGSEDAQGDGAAGGNGSGSGGQVDLVKRTGIFTKAEKTFSSVRSQLEAAVSSAAGRLLSVPGVEAELGTFEGDKAFDSYCKTLVFRAHIGMVCLGTLSSASLRRTTLSLKDIGREKDTKDDAADKPMGLGALGGGTQAASGGGEALEPATVEGAAVAPSPAEGAGPEAPAGPSAASASATAPAPTPGPASADAGTSEAKPGDNPQEAVQRALTPKSLDYITCPYSTFKEAFDRNPRKLPIKSPDDLATVSDMQQSLNGVLELEDVAEIEAFQATWQRNVAAAKALIASIGKGDAAVKQHIANKRSRLAKDKKIAKTEEEKKHLEATKAKAKAIAEKLKASRVQTDLAIMKCSFDCFTDVHVEAQATTSVSDGQPIVYTGSEAVNEWAAN